MKFSVIGGDMRLIKLSHQLLEDGNDVLVFGQEKADGIGKVSIGKSLDEVVKHGDFIILPLPVETGDYVTAPFSNEKIKAADILDMVSPYQTVFGGRVGIKLKSYAEKCGVNLIDYFEREELTVRNAYVTAEGAVQILMEELPITISGSKCLILGYGRIGKILAHLLKGLGAKVTASARKPGDIAWIKVFGYDALNTYNIEGKLSDFDVVINTIPSKILTKPLLGELKKDVLILDLASKPGGTDFICASQMGLKVIWALGIPGEAAPQAAGGIIKDTIYNIVGELESKK